MKNDKFWQFFFDQFEIWKKLGFDKGTLAAKLKIKFNILLNFTFGKS